MSNKNSVWVCLEQTGGKIAGVSYEMLSGARKLANELSGEVCAVLMGHQVQAQAKEAFAYGADKVYVCDNENLEHYNTGAYCKVLEKLVKENEPEILLLVATTNGRDLAGRLASRLETGLAADCTALALEDGQLVATRPTYGGNIMAEVVFPEKRPAMCTIRGNAMSKDDPDASKTGEVITVAYDVDDAELRTKVKEIIAKASGEISLADAQIIVSGGRGLGDPSGFDLIRKAAATLGAAVGASRAAVDAGGSLMSIRLARPERPFLPSCTSPAGFPSPCSIWLV